MAQDVHKITALDWQPALHALGDIVASYDDIAQCIRIILVTPKGSDPHRPEFGCDLWRFLDYPINQAVPHIVREVVDALRLWEKRIEVVRVTASVPSLATPEKVVVSVVWRIAGQSQSGVTTTEVPL